ncbi:GNAT family N-acetyltransferase [Mammaliicoccus stepanovicii]|nr:GNAT family N-acetyltransferase [Mammaliicoccus stepanovicii]
MTIERITEKNQVALTLPNEPFNLFGKLLVSRTNQSWNHSEILTKSESMTFPDENYTLNDINRKGFAIGAFERKVCVGLAVFEYNWNNYLYLNDLKVATSHRRQDIATKLIDKAILLTKSENINGIYTVAQDNNLAANRFYLRYGFEIGGLNTKNYHFTNQQGKSDIYYYLDF